jgi:predicted O-methyltransferase YrrM
VWSALDPNATYAQQPSASLLDVAINGISAAREGSLDRLRERAADAQSAFAAWVDAFPGEHYRLLDGLVRTTRPRLVVEIGTYTGASALAFLEHGAADMHVVSYDIIPWKEIPGSLLEPSDFVDGRLEQRIGNLADPAYWGTQLELFRRADLIFLDGPKDAVFEPIMLDRLAQLESRSGFLLIVDDIRFLEMLSPWAKFPSPKMDVSSFGHWSGTGLALVGPASAPRSDDGAVAEP